ncbi:MAG: transcriptional repressor LexA [Chloroflexia bacterium]
MSKQISDRQSRILAFITEFINKHNYSPSVRDIQDGVAPRVSSTSVVDYNLKALEERGLIRRTKNISRAIELVDRTVSRAQATFRIPVAPSPIAAGMPIPVLDDVLADGNGEDLDVSEALLGRYTAHPENLYALRVKGYSMIEDLINDGDVVIILRSKEEAEAGQTVVAWLRNENEVTLKRYYPEGSRVRLQPANKSMEPIYTSAENLEIWGRVVGVLRTVD